MNKTEIKLNEKNLKEGFSFTFRNEIEELEIEIFFSGFSRAFHFIESGILTSSFRSFNGMKKALDKKIKEQNLEFIESDK
jgi:hypothetical protein